MTGSSISTQKFNITSVIDSLVEYCKSMQYGLAVWSLPSSDIKNVLISYKPITIHSNKIESLESGFVVAAFESAAKGEKLFLKKDIYFKVGVGSDIDDLSNLLPDLKIGRLHNKASLVFNPVNQKEMKKYENFVNLALKSINRQEHKKLVLARKKNVKYSGTISVGNVFENISIKFKTTFNSIVYTPFYGLWIGASPETLVSRNAFNIFKTVALAGTQQATGKTEKEAVWNQKEIEEQAYVSRFIVERLKQIRLREFDDIGPKTVRVGHLFHLKTEFLVDLNEVKFPDLLSDMLELLHPTSAVCGMPKEEAMKFVLENEPFSRELYSGYLGPVNIENETHIFVNLRCVKVSEDAISFFAGAGVTEDSDPEKEFMETETKMESLKDCF